MTSPFRHGGTWRGLLWRGVLVSLLVAASVWTGLDHYAEQQVEAALTRALVAFAIARGLNGVISVVQGTEVAIQPAGVGVKLAPGELLDPVNDLIEQFSSIMLMASASLGLQRLMIGMSAWLPLTLLLVVAAAGWFLACWHRDRRALDSPMIKPGVLADPLKPRPGHRLAAILQGVLVILVLLRFAVPLSALASEAAYRIFLAPEYEQSAAELENAHVRIGAAGEALKPPPPDEGLLDKAARWWDSAADSVNVQKRIEDLQVAATEVTRNVVDLIAIFVVQTVVLPLLFGWLVWIAVMRGLPRLWSATH